MNAVQISISGAGKTTIAAGYPARRGLAVIDADDDPWLARRSWAWNPARLDELIGAAAPATLYVCGCADNELMLADRFTQVFLLEIDEPTMLGRLAGRDKEWGRIGDTREYQRRKLRKIRAACAHQARFPSTPGGPWTKWSTRYSHT